METKDTLKPVREAKDRLSVVLRLAHEEPKEVQRLRSAWLEFVRSLVSANPYLEAYTKVSLMIPRDAPGYNQDYTKNPFFAPVMYFRQYYGKATDLVLDGHIDSSEFEMCLVPMRNSLEMIELDHEPLEEIMRKAKS